MQNPNKYIVHRWIDFRLLAANEKFVYYMFATAESFDKILVS